jgi:hypothetical protein
VVPPAERPGGARIAHHLPERTRLLLRGHGLAEEDQQRIVVALGSIAGVRTVKVNPRTASVLCTHEPSIDPTTLEQAVAAAVTATEPRPRPGTSAVARALALLFRDLNREVLDATEGRLDAPTLASLTFLVAGALGLAQKERISPPPWFNLAWWSFRTFVTLEGETIQAVADDDTESDQTLGEP